MLTHRTESLTAWPVVLAALPALLVPLSPAAGEEARRLEAVEVTADADSQPNVEVSDGPATVYEVGPAGVRLWGGQGGTNPYSAVSGMPSVNFQSADPYGLTNLPGGVKGMRVRGELSTHGGTGTVEGIPLTGVGPGPGYQWLFDSENYASVSLGQGPIAPDRLAFYTSSGALDTRLRWPEESLGFQISQTIGSFDLERTFARIDSGRWPDGTALFVSASTSQASKWRGPGSSPDDRANLEAAIERPIGERGNIKLYAAYNDMQADKYRPLTYAQAKDLSRYRTFDYLDKSSAKPTDAVNYYRYNGQDFQDWAVFSEISWRLGESSQILFKPFYVKENGWYLDGMGNGKVRQWLLDHDWYGAILEGTARVAETDLKLGYWWDSLEPPGPPTAWKMYTPNGAGTLGAPVTWSILAKVADRRRFDSAYGTAERRFGALQVKGGLRYVIDTQPGLDFYDTKGIGNVSYEDALALSAGVIPERSVKPISMREWLPFLALAYQIDPRVTVNTSLGRNYGAPSFDIWPVYQQNYASFHAQGISANQLWQDMRPETSDAVDLGLKATFERAWIAPTLYYARYHDKAVSYDPDGSGPLVAFSQNIAQSEAWGAQFTGNWSPAAGWDLFGSIAWDNNAFTEDLPLVNGGVLAVKGHQLPDVPKWSGNLGVTWRNDVLSITPLVRFMDSRFGDTEHTQEVPGYATVDVTLTYRRKVPRGTLTASLTVTNLLDEQYVGFINASYYQLLSDADAIYYPGSPRAVVGQIALAF